MSRRTERIAEQLRTEIARILMVEATDPRIRFVTLTRVDVTSDLSRAVVFWSALESGSGSSEEVGAGLRSAAPFVRSRLAKLLPLRRIPELHFRYDPSLVKGDEMLALLRTLSPDADSPDTDPAKAQPDAAPQTGAADAPIPIESKDGETT